MDVVVVRYFEDSGTRLAHPFISRSAKVAAAEVVRDHAGFHDREVEQVAGEHLEAGFEV